MTPRCLKCGYEGPVDCESCCPECGSEESSELPPPWPVLRKRHRLWLICMGVYAVILFAAIACCHISLRFSGIEAVMLFYRSAIGSFAIGAGGIVIIPLVVIVRQAEILKWVWTLRDGRWGGPWFRGLARLKIVMLVAFAALVIWLLYLGLGWIALSQIEAPMD